MVPSKVMEDDTPLAVMTAVVDLSLEEGEGEEEGEVVGDEGAEEEEETEA